MSSSDEGGLMARTADVDGHLDSDGGEDRRIPWLLVPVPFVLIVASATGLFHPFLDGTPDVLLVTTYGALATAVYFLSVVSGPVPVVERLLAGVVTYAWFYTFVPEANVVRQTLESSAFLALLVPAGVLLVTLVHLLWQSGFLHGARDPRLVYADSRNLALIYAPAVYVAAGNVVLAL